MILGGKLPGKVGRSRFFGPMVKRLRHGPFTAVTGVRFPVGLPDEPYVSAALFIRGCGGIGRHAGFRFLFERVRVQVPSGAFRCAVRMDSDANSLRASLTEASEILYLSV